MLVVIESVVDSQFPSHFVLVFEKEHLFHFACAFAICEEVEAVKSMLIA
jgi:hypothetical protein